MHQALTDWATKKGYRVSFAQVSLLDLVKERLEKLRADGEFAAGFFEENLDIFKYAKGSSLRGPKAIFIVAVPVPAWVLRFELEQESVETILPPTYVQYRPLFERVRNEIKDEVLGKKDNIETLQAPLKSLAVGAGLASYGRNNITYVPEFGSYFQLAGYILDVPIEGDIHPGKFDRKLDLRSSCRACIKACTMKAVAEDRFLIHAERCYTLHSESPRPIPERIKPPSPDCLIGCLRCQEVCPANKSLLRREHAHISFNAEETAALAGDQDIRDHRLNESIHSKFKTLALTEGVPILRRNLRRLLEIRSRT
jgi:epoxyqueuosine reductase